MKNSLRSGGNLLFGTALAGLFLSTLTANAGSLVGVSTGYEDYPPGPNSNGFFLNPWDGSANTTFFGNSAQALSGDPDEDAILLQNFGTTDITLSALSIGSGTYDLFALDGIGAPVTLAPGTFYVFAGVDGSDAAFGPGVSLTLDSTGYSYLDTTTGTSPTGGNYVLHGFPGGDEAVDWTPIYTPSQGNLVPDSGSTLGLIAASLFGLFLIRRGLSRDPITGQ